MQLTIKPLPPFDFDLSAQIFSNGDERMQRYEGGVYWQAIRLGGRLALIRVRSTATIADPQLSVKIEPEDAFSLNDKANIETYVIRLFNPKQDLLTFYEAVKGNDIMAQITKRLWGLRSPTTSTVFEVLIDSIIEQQISLKAAKSMQRRLIETFGDALILGAGTYFVFPRPERLAAATIEELRACGLPGRKAEYVRGAGKLVAEGLDLEALQVYDEADIIEELSKIRGVGLWTAEMTMIRGMQKYNVIPADDLGLRRVISHYYYGSEKIDAKMARRIAKGWDGWRGLASYYLIVAEQLGIEAGQVGR
jgi:DNA-3-methyladenine glycosylase II